MIAVLQRVTRASVTADGVPTGSCGAGFVILLGVLEGDGEEEARLLAEKISKFRIFSDENGKMNLSAESVGAGIAIVSNFTLYANTSHGNRPDFFDSARPDVAEALYCRFIDYLKTENLAIITGIFGADMQIHTQCDGPVTLILDSADMKKGK